MDSGLAAENVGTGGGGGGGGGVPSRLVGFPPPDDPRFRTGVLRLGAAFFLAGARFADDLRRVVFRAADFLREDFFTADFRRDDFFTAVFLRADFFAADFLREPDRLRAAARLPVADFLLAFFAVFRLPAFRPAIGISSMKKITSLRLCARREARQVCL
ncbi:MAG: hypothetical protein ABI681_09475 [Gemmatimonadales bacterium]